MVISSDPACMSQRYPEFCRKLLYEDATPEFLEATAEWEKAYGKVRPAFQIIIKTCCSQARIAEKGKVFQTGLS